MERRSSNVLVRFAYQKEYTWAKEAARERWLKNALDGEHDVFWNDLFETLAAEIGYRQNTFDL